MMSKETAKNKVERKAKEVKKAVEKKVDDIKKKK